MSYKFEFSPYQRRFRQPIQTSNKTWEVRQGIIIRLTDNEGKNSLGEIAPLPWFGSETLDEALVFCRQIGEIITSEIIQLIPDHLAACQFGFESAIEFLNTSIINYDSLNNCYLLPAGKAALNSWLLGWETGKETFKWKIGVYPLAIEIKIFEQLIESLPSNAKLRLDANGGLTWQEAKEWLKILDQTTKVEFLEQPLSPSELNSILALSEQYSTPLALDESVATFSHLQDCYQQGWRGIYIIKAAIAGSPQRLKEFCQSSQLDAVFSSVFETSIGENAALNLAQQLSNPSRALGFGVNHWFLETEEDWLEDLWTY